MRFVINPDNKEAIYRQLVLQVDQALHSGKLKAGEQIPSMNELAAQLAISRETVKKAYGILVKKGLIHPKQGKGFYTADVNASTHPRVLVLFDKFSVYKQILFNAFAERLADAAEITILNHNQSIDLLEHYLDDNLDNFDYYVLAPHFPLDAGTQKRVVRQLSRIPYRKLIMLDRLQPDFPGQYGAVYQDFENDIYDGLAEGTQPAFPARRLRVLTLPMSLYGTHIIKGVNRFVSEHHVPAEYMTTVPNSIEKGDIFLVLNSQLDDGLVALTRRIQEAGLEIGRDVFIISYNESDMNELVLGGLTTVSTDFREMGRLAADMILSRRMEKVHCPFHMHRRHTF